MRGLAVCALALGLAGCVTGRPQGGGFAEGPRAVAFESIDGAPRPVFQALVRKLNEEADARQLPVVSRESYAPYRIRAYLAASVLRKETILSWVFDVYDGETQRAVRLAGEEKAGFAGRDAWQAADEAVLARIARAGMEQLHVFLGGADAGSPLQPAPAGPAEEAGAAVAGLPSSGHAQRVASAGAL